MFRLRFTGGLIAVILAACPAFGSLRAQEPATVGDYNDEAAGYYQQAQDWEAQGNTKRAITSYRTLVREYPLARSASAAQFRLGELYDSLGNSKRAFDSYQKLLEDYPQSREFDRAVDSQVAIADA